MKLENQVCTLEQSKKLNDLGVEQNLSIRTWVKTPYKGFMVGFHNEITAFHENYSAFTVAELGLMLPDDFIKYFDFKGYAIPKSQDYQLNFYTWFFYNDKKQRTFGCRYDYDGNINIATSNFVGTEAEARAALIIYLLENNLAKVEDVNVRLREENPEMSAVGK